MLFQKVLNYPGTSIALYLPLPLTASADFPSLSKYVHTKLLYSYIINRVISLQLYLNLTLLVYITGFAFWLLMFAGEARLRF